MSSPMSIPGGRKGAVESSEEGTPPPILMPSPSNPAKYLVPSPLPTRRSRTVSMSERALQGPTHVGFIKSFHRDKGHGFVMPVDAKEDEALFLHISDIEGDFVPQVGDEVTFKTILVPPKNDKFQAVHVKIRHRAESVPHETWDKRLPSNSSNT